MELLLLQAQRDRRGLVGPSLKQFWVGFMFFSQWEVSLALAAVVVGGL